MAGYERQVKGMAVTLSSQEVAALTGKTERTIRRWAENGKIPAERTLNKFNSPEYFFSLNDLTPDLQEKYYSQLRASLPEASETAAVRYGGRPPSVWRLPPFSLSAWATSGPG